MAYAAVVAKIDSISPIPGADRIRLANVLGYQVAVGTEYTVGDVVAFFPADGQLSEELCQKHDLVRRKDAEGKPAGGYFEENRRVKAVKMRGAKSEGFVLPIRCIFDLNPGARTDLAVGSSFTEFGGVQVCQRYETPATRRAAQQNKGRTQRRGETLMFRKQPDIEQFRIYKNTIPAGSVVYITEKLHGTSHRVSRTLDEVPMTRWEKFVDRLGLWYIKPRKEWVYLNGSKNVILEKADQRESYYGSDAFRYKATEGLELRKGETVYGELVGWHGPDINSTIMGRQVVSKKERPEVYEAYGPEMTYSYGCEPGKCQFWVYRITMSNEDGFTVELSFPQVQKRTEELGLKCVPLLAAEYLIENNCAFGDFVDRLVDGKSGQDTVVSTVDSRHIQEGVVVRYESAQGTGWLKHKGLTFKILEGIVKDSDTYVDMEESS